MLVEKMGDLEVSQMIQTQLSKLIMAAYSIPHPKQNLICIDLFYIQNKVPSFQAMLCPIPKTVLEHCLDLPNEPFKLLLIFLTWSSPAVIELL